MTSVERVEATLYRTLAESRGSTPEVVQGQIGGAGEIDSLEGVELIIAAEAEFGIRIEETALTAHLCRSIPRIAELVAARMAAGNGRQGG